MAANRYDSSYTGTEHDTYVTKSQLVDLIYPVGSIYISLNSTNPTALFGGSWEAVQDRFLLGASNTYAGSATGGTTSHTHTTGNHTLTAGQLPKLSGSARMGWGDGSAAGIMVGGTAGIFGSSSGTAYYVGSQHSGTYQTNLTINFGNNEAHNHGNTGSSSNLPPYLAVYMWKRVA